MSAKSAIFIFTRDRPQTLQLTLNSINAFEEKIFIIDDSVVTKNRLQNQNILNPKKHHYLGIDQFNSFINQFNLNSVKFSFLLRTLGDSDWNLGYARNFALLFARSRKLEYVLFMDDDIEVQSVNLIHRLFDLKNEYAFTGSYIKGLIDDSIMGHIATDLGIFNERMLSGGFMVFNPFEIQDFFLNNYNEDWIWLFLQLKGKKYIQFGDVFQATVKPLENYKNKIMFQEFGEIALDGILDLFPAQSYRSLKSLSFWERMVKERGEYLSSLFEKTNHDMANGHASIINYVKTNSHEYTPLVFKQLFEQYFYNRDFFKKAYNTVF